jgi:hypothetical protein
MVKTVEKFMLFKNCIFKLKKNIENKLGKEIAIRKIFRENILNFDHDHGWNIYVNFGFFSSLRFVRLERLLGERLVRQ